MKMELGNFLAWIFELIVVLMVIIVILPVFADIAGYPFAIFVGIILFSAVIAQIIAKLRG